MTYRSSELRKERTVQNLCYQSISCKNPTEGHARCEEHRKQQNKRQQERHKEFKPIVYRYHNPQTRKTIYVGRGTIHRAKSHGWKTGGTIKSHWWTPDLVLHIMYARNEWHSMKLEGLWGELFRPTENIEGTRR